MAGRKAMEREEKRQNGIAVPMLAVEKAVVKAEASRLGLSAAGFIRMLIVMYFEKEANK